MNRCLKIGVRGLLLSAIIAPLALAAELSSSEFLDRARNPNGAATYGMLDGTLQHRRRGEDTLTVPIYFGIIIMPERTVGQLLVDNRESYLLGQSRDARHDGTSVVHSPDCVLLDRVGVTPLSSHTSAIERSPKPSETPNRGKSVSKDGCAVMRSLRRLSLEKSRDFITLLNFGC